MLYKITSLISHSSGYCDNNPIINWTQFSPQSLNESVIKLIKVTGVCMIPPTVFSVNIVFKAIAVIASSGGVHVESSLGGYGVCYYSNTSMSY